MKSKYSYFVILLFVFCQSVYATPQVGDKLVFEVEEFSVYMFKLSDELREQVERARIQEGRIVTLSSNWDGFYACLEIRKNKLYLTSLSVDSQLDGESIKELIPLDNSEGVFASWFSGELREIIYGKNHRKIKKTVRFFFENGVLIERKNQRGPVLNS